MMVIVPLYIIFQAWDSIKRLEVQNKSLHFIFYVLFDVKLELYLDLNCVVLRILFVNVDYKHLFWQLD